METLFLALRRLRSTRRTSGLGPLGVVLMLAGGFCFFTVLDYLHDNNIVSLDDLGSGYLYMANMRCVGEEPGVVDMVLQVSLGITGPVFFASGDDNAVSKAKAMAHGDCSLINVIQRMPYYRFVYPRQTFSSN